MTGNRPVYARAKRLPCGAAVLLCALLLVAAQAARADDAILEQPARLPRIAIIIDDLGYALDAGARAVHLPGPVACAVLPQTPRARQLSALARAYGKDVLLHLPLQASLPDTHSEPGGIVLDMTRGELSRAFAASLDAVPGAIGVSNHRGSLLTRHPGLMGWLMEEISARGDLFFVDSYTTAKSVALEVAEESGVQAVRRDVFLDNDRRPQSLAAEFARLKRLAKRRGAAVAIGHPYPETLAFLEQVLPGLAQDGFELVSISDMVRQRAH